MTPDLSQDLDAMPLDLKTPDLVAPDLMKPDIQPGICAGKPGTVCRAKNGLCDLAEKCVAGVANCPKDSFVLVGVKCRASTGACDPAEYCTGAAATCPSNVTWTLQSNTFYTGPGVSQAKLYATSFSFPFDSTAWTGLKSYLKDFTTTKGSQTLNLQTNAVKTGGSNQFTILYPKPGQLKDVYKRFATSTGVVLTNCAAKTPWALQVTHCGP